MEYNDLNSYLGNLELSKTIQRNPNLDFEENKNTNSFVNTEFLDSNKFNDTSIKNKPKSKTQIENLSINRNMDLSSLNREFNFESVNPQRIQAINTRNISRDDIRNNSNSNSNLSNDMSHSQNTNVNFELNRNLQVHRNINTMVMDYSQFSENYKSYKNNDFSKDFDRDNLNEKISSRDNIPNISSVPSSLWEN